MKKVRTKALSFITALLLVFTLLPFLPEGFISADAASDIVEVSTESEIVAALKDNSNKGKTIFLMEGFKCECSKVNITFPVTLNLNAKELSIPEGIVIDMPNESDTLNITGGGTIRGFSEEQAPILLKKGKLNFYDGSVFSAYNYDKKTGPDTIESKVAYSNITIIDGEFTSGNKLSDNVTLEDGTFRRDDYSSNTLLWTTKISQKYGIRVSGVEATAVNKADILGGGEASFDLDTKTLTLKKDITTENKNAIEYEFKGVPGLTIKVAKNVTLNSGERDGIVVRQNATITGSKLLKVKSKSSGISVNAGIVPIKKSFTLNIENARIEIYGGNNGIIGEESAILNIKNSYINASSKSAGISRFATITNSGSKIYLPTDGKITRVSSDFMSITDKNGDVAKTVYMDCEHDLTQYASKTATCTAKGNIEYWQCKKCGRCFSDNGGFLEIDADDVIIPQRKHTFTEVAEKRATCTTDGNKHYYYCSECKKKYMDNMGIAEYEGNSWIIPKTGHNMSRCYAQEATCTEDGSINYYVCLNCYKYFKDKDGKNEIAKEKTVIPKGHKWGTPSWTWTGTTAANASFVCQRDKSHTQSIDATITSNTTKPTCTDAGKTVYTATVKLNGKAYTDTKTVSLKAKGHTLTKTAAKAATCTAKGNKAYWTCSECKKVFEDKDAKTETTVAKMTVPATGHNYGTPTYEWSKDNKTVTATRVCLNDKKHTQTETVKATAKTTNPTCTKAGQTVYKSAAFKNTAFKVQTKTVAIKATGHKFSAWKTTSFDVDKMTATQKRTCTRGDKTETKTVTNAVVRFAGSDRAQTASLISNGMYKSADTVIIATGFDFHDALAAVPLASAYNAPLLLADRDNLSDKTIAEIKRLKAKNVIVVASTNAKDQNGYDAAIKSKVYSQLKELKVKVTKLDGKSYYATAKKVADALGKKKAAPTSVFITTDKNYADALSASPVAAILGAPILYVDPKASLNATTKNYLASIKKNVKNVYIVGGVNAVSTKVEKAILNTLGKKSATRFAGNDRYDTCVLINKSFAKNLTGKSVCIAKGYNFPDALAGGVFAAKNKAPLFLADALGGKAELSKTQSDYLKSKNPNKLYIFGGETAIPTALVKSIAKASV